MLWGISPELFVFSSPRHLRFLNCTGGAKTPSDSIREVSVIKALRAAGFDAEMFEERGGVYDWSKAGGELSVCVFGCFVFSFCVVFPAFLLLLVFVSVEFRSHPFLFVCFCFGGIQQPSGASQ